MTSLLGRMLRLFPDNVPLEDLFTEAVTWLFERRPKLCIAWLREEGTLPPGPTAGDEEGHRRVTSQKWLGSLGQQDEASRVDLQITVHWSTTERSEDREAIADVVTVESKIGSREGHDQLRRYAEHLHKMKGYRSKTLLYITRAYDPKDPEKVLSGIDDVRLEQRRWRDFYRFLQGVEEDALMEEVMVFMEEQGMGRDYRLSADDLIALSRLPRALDILEETIDAEVREELARFSGNELKRTRANLIQQIRGDEGYYVYASLDREENFGCYLGYAMRTPDGYPRLQVGLYANADAEDSEVMKAVIERVSHLESWQLYSENTEEHEVWREMNVASLLGEKDHIAAAKDFFVESIHQLREVLTAFKNEYPELLWERR